MTTTGGCKGSHRARTFCFAFGKTVTLTEYSYLRISSNQAVQRAGASRFAQTQINRQGRPALVADLCVSSKMKIALLICGGAVLGFLFFAPPIPCEASGDSNAFGGMGRAKNKKSIWGAAFYNYSTPTGLLDYIEKLEL